MPPHTPSHQIRAQFDQNSLTIYQAYGPQIAVHAANTGTFAAPFSFHRMTWLKPSFLWLMARSQWAQKPGQEHILAIRLRRDAWEQALAEAVLTSPEKNVYASPQQWDELFQNARVHVQWDPERNIRGDRLQHRSIQVGIGRQLIRSYVDDWILSIEEITPLVRKIHRLCVDGKHNRAQRHLPHERPYPLPDEIAQKIGSHTSP